MNPHFADKTNRPDDACLREALGASDAVRLEIVIFLQETGIYPCDGVLGSTGPGFSGWQLPGSAAGNSTGPHGGGA